MGHHIASAANAARDAKRALGDNQNSGHTLVRTNWHLGSSTLQAGRPAGNDLHLWGKAEHQRGRAGYLIGDHYCS